MKALKIIIIALLVVIGTPLIIALFLPKDFNAGSEIVINRPKEEVFNYVKYVENQENYGVWQLSDPSIKKTTKGVDGTVGYVYQWEGEKTGKGKQTITAIKANERIDSELDFGFGEPAQAYMVVSDEGSNQTRVVWKISGKSPYPFNFMGLFYDMNKDFEKGLQNLKEVLEGSM